MKVALVIGHNEQSQGAYNSSTGETEFLFNDRLVNVVARMLIDGSPIIPSIIYRDKYKDLPAKVNSRYPDFIISFHCNAFNTEASGTETLYYHKSNRSASLAAIIQEQMVEALKLPDRGIKPKASEDRGGYLLRYTNAPCVIIEPFFIDNAGDLFTATDKFEQLASAIYVAIEEYAKVYNG